MARCKQPSYSRNNTSTPYPLRPRGPAALQRQEPTVHIEDCDVRRGRTSPPDHCVQTPVTWRRTQSSNTKYVPDTEHSPTPGTSPPAEDPHPSNGPSNRLGRRGRTTRPADRIPRISPQPVRCALAARPARTTTCAPVRPSGPPPRTCQALRVRPRRSACPDSTGSLPSHSQESPSQQPRSLKNPRLSGGTSGRYWAASADSLRAYRRPSGQSLWNSWTPCPTCGVCVTTTLPQCPNGVRDH